ncbi:MAG: peptidase, partial [Blastocatellia bacterium]
MAGAIWSLALLGIGEEVYWIKQPFTAGGVNYPAGTIFIPAKSTTAARVQKLATDLGLRFAAMTAKPNVTEMYKLRQPRIALWDRYGGSMPSGWTRWILEQFEFPFTVVYPQTLDAGNLADKFDVIVFVTQAIPGVRGGGGPAAGGSDEPP